ncbi:hypothetical protein D3C72_1253900 [compost metagenome]
MMRRPPSSVTLSCSSFHSARSASTLLLRSDSDNDSSDSMAAICFSMLPPSTMSVPRPAMLVAMVIMPGRPAWAMISASRSCCLALSTWCGRFSFFRSSSMISEFSIEVVPTSTGWPRS